MPEKYGSWSTVYDRFREWRDAKVFKELWAKCLHFYNKCLHFYKQKHRVIREWRSGDGTYVRSPCLDTKSVWLS